MYHPVMAAPPGMTSFALFDTALGTAGLAWGKDGVIAVSFPSSEEDARRGLARRAAGAAETSPPPEWVALIADIRALLQGEKRDLAGARLDLSRVGDFERRVYAMTRAIGPGSVKTYGEIARAMGDAALARRIGQALGRNPFPIIVPCHRVIGGDGRMVGFSAPGGAEAKRRLLKIEGALALDLFDQRRIDGLG